jgi:hypothetical protein
MKQLILFIAISLYAFTTWSQEKTQIHPDTLIVQDTLKQGRVYVNIGVAFPTGSFKSQFVTVDRINGVKRGGMIVMGYSHDIHRLIALGASMGMRINEVDDEGYLKRFNAQGLNKQTLEDARSGLWKTSFLLADLFVQMPFRNIILYSKFSYGLAYTEHPTNYMRYTEQIYAHYEGREIEWSAEPVFSVAYGFAGGLRYEIGKFGIGIEAGWFATKPNFNLNFSKPLVYEQDEKYQMNSNNCLVQLSYCL